MTAVAQQPHRRATPSSSLSTPARLDWLWRGEHLLSYLADEATARSGRAAVAPAAARTRRCSGCARRCACRAPTAACEVGKKWRRHRRPRSLAVVDHALPDVLRPHALEAALVRLEEVGPQGSWPWPSASAADVRARLAEPLSRRRQRYGASDDGGGAPILLAEGAPGTSRPSRPRVLCPSVSQAL